MKLIASGLILSLLLFTPLKAQAQSITPTPIDYDQRLQKLQDELNQLELQNEKIQSHASAGGTGSKPILSLDGGSLEQDFESNSNSWSILQGQTLNLRFAANPTTDSFGHFDLMFLGKVAPDILHYSFLPILANSNIFVVLKEADATFNTPLLSFRAFTGFPRDTFYYSNDDFYYLFPAQNDVDNPFRVSGTLVDTGMEIKGLKDLDGLDIWAGTQLNWGVNQEAVLMYKHDIAGMTAGIMDKISLQNISQGALGYQLVNTSGVTVLPPQIAYAPVPVTVTTYSYSSRPTNETEAFWRIPVPNAFTLDAVMVYNPTNANMPYTYVKTVAPGTGTDGTSYQLYTATTNNTGDAMGYQVKLTSTSVPLIDSIMLNGEYSGVIAGDLERVSGEITKMPVPGLLFTFSATAQQPLVGPNPLVFNGTPLNSIGTLVQPRGQFDPFQVDMNPITGVNNRQMNKFSLSFVYNEGKGWFFKYNPNDFSSWNINMDLDTDFSTGMMATLFNYPTSSDLSSFVLGNSGVVSWETPGELGQPATNGYLPYLHWVTMWKASDIHWVADIQGGYSMATLGQSTISTVTGGRNSTDSFLGTLTTRIHDTSLSLSYGQDVWGPEDWDRQFGLVIGQLIVAQVTQKFGLSQISLKYEHWGNLPGDPYQVPAFAFNDTVNLPIDELYATYTLNF